MSPEPVGSLAEEAAKLVSVLSSMQVGGHSGADHGNEHDPADEADEAHEGHDPLSPECRYCPLCAIARTARSMTPEVREHLASAAGSLLLAVRGFLEDAMASGGPSADRASGDADSDGDAAAGVEKIDLAED
jgi:hypothetical protein